MSTERSELSVGNLLGNMSEELQAQLEARLNQREARSNQLEAQNSQLESRSNQLEAQNSSSGRAVLYIEKVRYSRTTPNSCDKPLHTLLAL